MYRRILVPLDGSEHSEAALPHAAAVARALGAHLELVRAVMLPTLIGSMPEVALPPSYDSSSERRVVQDYLDRLADGIRTEGLEISTTVLEGPPGEVVVEHARRTNTELLVVSFHGRRGLRRWIQGSTAERISRRSPCPVLIVKPGQEDAARGGRGGRGKPR